VEIPPREYPFGWFLGFLKRPHWSVVVFQDRHAQPWVANDGVNSWLDSRIFVCVSVVNDGGEVGIIDRWELELRIRGVDLCFRSHPINTDDGFWKAVVDKTPSRRRLPFLEQQIMPGAKHSGWLCFTCPVTTPEDLVGVPLRVFLVTEKKRIAAVELSQHN
jgi:hypothetical protein